MRNVPSDGAAIADRRVADSASRLSQYFTRLVDLMGGGDLRMGCQRANSHGATINSDVLQFLNSADVHNHGGPGET